MSLAISSTTLSAIGSQSSLVPPKAKIFGLSKHLLLNSRRVSQSRCSSKPLPSKIFQSFMIQKTRRYVPRLSSKAWDRRTSFLCRSGSSEFENKEEGNGWVTSFFLFIVWAGLLYYVIVLSPNQTQARDAYFVQKLFNLKVDDGFQMNSVLVSLWNIMGLWPIIYSMLLLPTGRSSESRVPVWPFLVLSMFGGAYALMPYFILWRPPAPMVDKEETMRFPLKIFESKITAVTVLIGGLVLIINAGMAGEIAWKEFVQYFRESKLVHATSIDFLLLTSFAPFWVYNDMTARNWFDKGKWFLPLTLLPFIGPCLYLVFRPPCPHPMPSEKQSN